MFPGNVFSMKSASILLASAVTVGAVGMIAAGPDAKDKRWRGPDRDRGVIGNITISLGRDDDRRRPFPPPPAICPPAPCEAAPLSLDLDAYQAGDTIVLVAKGQNPTPGFATSLERTRRFGEQIITLRNLAPVQGPHGHGFVTQCLTGFEVAGSFNTPGCVNQITVFVAGTPYTVQVRRADAIVRTL